MSSWDRQAVVKKYKALLDASDDPGALMETLGTPTRLAITLARTYVPSSVPAEEDEAAQPAEPEEEIPEQLSLELEPEEELPPEEPETVSARKPGKKLRAGLLIVYLIPAIVIGLPVALILVCVGLPFLGAGAALGTVAVQQAVTLIGRMMMISDILLVAGAGLVLAAAALLLCWFGIWVSITLCRLWISGAVVGLGRRLCVKKEAA